MSCLIRPTALACFGIAGVLSHRLFFIRGEHHLRGPWYLATWIVSLILMIVMFSSSNNDASTFESVILVHCSFFGPLFASIFVYRVFQHPLRQFDGPFLASVSKLWHLAYMFKSPNHLFLNTLVQKYGNFVRTGPQELTIVDPGVWVALGKRDAPCKKSPFYDMLYPYVALISIRNKEAYRTRRKLWDDALRLATTHLPDDDSPANELAEILVQQVKASVGEVVNIKTLFFNYAYDVVGEIAFGQSFSLLKKSDLAIPYETRNAPTLISDGISMLRFFTPVPWAARLSIILAPYLPEIARHWNEAQKWTSKVCDSRLEREGELCLQKDAFSRFIRAARADDDAESLDRLALYGDAFTFTIAGSHTIATTLTMLFFELARHPHAQRHVREEILSASHRNETTGETRDRSIEKYCFLDACIDETLRLYPAVPTGGIRQTTERGMHIAGKWIPPYTVIVSPRWTLGRLETAFELPDKFIPERWTTKPYLVKDARAFNAFGLGQHICPGKQLGLAEVRLVATKLLTQFQFEFPSKQINTSRIVETLQDSFVLTPGDLELVFTPITKPT
ncbi:cytochrome P450 [Nemania sp. FL0916]|nr:cytochrome P450 [Nemania sp. FL0916]